MIFFTGDDVNITITIEDCDGNPYPVGSGSTVGAAIFSGESLLTPVTTCLEGTTGADWPNGVVVASFSSTDTASLPLGSAQLEVQIDDGGITTVQTTAQIEIKKGLIP